MKTFNEYIEAMAPLPLGQQADNNAMKQKAIALAQKIAQLLPKFDFAAYNFHDDNNLNAQQVNLGSEIYDLIWKLQLMFKARRTA